MAPSSRRWRFIRSIPLWLILYALSVTIYNRSHDAVSKWLIGWVQIRPAVFLLEQTLPDVPLRRTATSIRGDISIYGSCGAATVSRFGSC